MKFKKLEDEQRKFFDQNGYLTIPNALDSDMLEQVTAACDRIVSDTIKSQDNAVPVDFRFSPKNDAFLKLVTSTITGPAV